jgi:hypothetical protein
VSDPLGVDLLLTAHREYIRYARIKVGIVRHLTDDEVALFVQRVRELRDQGEDV